MQRLARMRRPFAYSIGFMKKEYGSEVSFASAKEIADSASIAAGLIAGALRYQLVAATVTQATHDAFVDGNMQELAAAIESAHPVKVLYMKFSWNESGLNITDLAIAVIFKVLSGSVTVNDIAATMRTVQWYENMRHEIDIAGPGDTGLGPNQVWILEQAGIPLELIIIAGVITAVIIAVAVTR